MLKIRLYCVLRKRDDLSFEDQAEQCCQGGAEAILMSGSLVSPKELVALGLKIRNICRKYKVLFFVGSRPDIALAVDADGVNLIGPFDVSVDLAKQILGPRKIVGVCGSSLGALVAAAEEGAGYIMVGPMFEEGKPGQDSPGLDIIRLVKKRVKVTVIASGSVTLDNLPEALSAGADGVAVSRAVCGAPSPKEAARKFLSIISEAAIKNMPAENR